MWHKDSAIPGITWWYLTIPGDVWQYLPIPADTCWYLLIPDNTQRYQTNITNSKQYLTNLVSAVIIWYWQYIKYHHQYNTICHGIVTMQYWWFCVCLVLLQYQLWWFSRNLWCLIMTHNIAIKKLKFASLWITQNNDLLCERIELKLSVIMVW
jgi:hypothetical protein